MIRLRLATIEDSSMLRKWADGVSLWTPSDEDGSFDWDFEIPRTVDWRELLVAESEGRPIGFIQITDAADEESHYWGDVEQGSTAIDIWIGDPVDRNNGFGSQMMQLAINRCFARKGAKSILLDPLDANEGACRFYERLGFTFIEKRTFGKDLCRVYRLERPQ